MKEFTRYVILKNIVTYLKGRTEKIIFLSGINLLLLNFLMVHQISMGLRQMEIAVILFSLSYFTSLSIGYYFSDKISFQKHSFIFLFIVIVQIFLLSFIHPISRIVYDYLETFLSPALGEVLIYGLVFIFLVIGGTSIYAIFLPHFVAPNRENLSKYYSIEIIGSIVGLLIAIPLMQLSFTLVVFLYFICYLVIVYLLGIPSKYQIAIAVVIIMYGIGFLKIENISTELFFKNKYPELNITSLVYTKHTPYQRIDVLELSNQERMIALNGRRQFAKNSHFNYSYFVAEFPSSFYSKPSVCVLGCGSMSTVGRIGQHASDISIVDIDKEVFAVSKKYFQKYNHLDSLNNWTFIEDDAKHYVANSEKKYDLIVHDIMPGRSRQTALTYTKEFFTNIKKIMKDSSIFSISALTPLKSSSHYSKRLVATLLNVFPNCFALQYNSNIYFYGYANALQLPEKEKIVSMINHSSKNNCEVLFKNDLEVLVEKSELITVNNLGDLVFE